MFYVMNKYKKYNIECVEEKLVTYKINLKNGCKIIIFKSERGFAKSYRSSSRV